MFSRRLSQPRAADWYRGTADALYQNLDFLKKSHEPYVVLASGDGIYKLDYNKVLEYHIEKRQISRLSAKIWDRKWILRDSVL